MTIMIPSAMGFRTKSFRLRHSQQISPSGIGYIQTLNRRVAMWSVEYSTGPVSERNLPAVLGFFDSLEGSLNDFYAYDPRRIMPFAYRHLPIAADPWTLAGRDNPIVVGINVLDSTITLGNMATGAIVTKGDYLAFNNGNTRWLFRAQNTLPVTGTSVIVEVKPRPQFALIDTPVLEYRRASMAAKMIGGYEEEDEAGQLPVYSFTAAQFLNRSI